MMIDAPKYLTKIILFYFHVESRRKLTLVFLQIYSLVHTFPEKNENTSFKIALFDGIYYKKENKLINSLNFEA